MEKKREGGREGEMGGRGRENSGKYNNLSKDDLKNSNDYLTMRPRQPQNLNQGRYLTLSYKITNLTLETVRTKTFLQKTCQ